MVESPTKSIVHSLTGVRDDYIDPVAAKICKGLKADGYSIIPTEDIDAINFLLTNPNLSAESVADLREIVGGWV